MPLIGDQIKTATVNGKTQDRRGCTVLVGVDEMTEDRVFGGVHPVRASCERINVQRVSEIANEVRTAGSVRARYEIDERSGDRVDAARRNDVTRESIAYGCPTRKPP